MAWIGLLPVLAGIAGVIWKAAGLKRVKWWVFLSVIVLELASYAVFSIFVTGNVLFLWLVIGLAAGVFFGKSNKLIRKGKVLCYKQNLILSLVYLGVLLANLLLLALTKAYLPFLLILGALALGIQTGFFLLILLLGKQPREKAKKETTEALPVILLLIFCMTLLSPSGFVFASSEKPAAHGGAEAAATSEPTVMDLKPEEIGILDIAEGNNTSYDELSGGNLGISLVFDKGKIGNSENGRAFQGGSLRFYNYYRVPASAGSIYQYGVDGTTVRAYYGFEIYKEKTNEELGAQLEVHAAQSASGGARVSNFQSGGTKVFRIYESSGTVEGVTYMTVAEETLFTLVYTYAAPLQPPLEQVDTYSPAKMTEGEMDALFENWTGRILESDEYAIEKGSKEEGEETEGGAHGMAKKSGPQKKEVKEVKGAIGALTNGKGFFQLVPVASGKAALASILGGLLAGGGMVFFALFTVMPEGFTLLTEDAGEKTPVYEESKTPGFGMRRSDGKFWSRNHGWLSEETPSVQMEKLKQTLSGCNFEIERAELADDKMMVELLQNEKERCLREYHQWVEDLLACRGEKHKALETEEAEAPRAYKGDLGTLAEKGLLLDLKKEKKKITQKRLAMQSIEKAGILPEEIPEQIHLLRAPADAKILEEAGVQEVLNTEILRSTGISTEAIARAFAFDAPGALGVGESIGNMIKEAEAFAQELLSKKR